MGRPCSIPGGVEARFTAESGGGGSQPFRRVSGDFPAVLVGPSGMKSVSLVVFYKFDVLSLPKFGRFGEARGAHSPPAMVARGGASGRGWEVRSNC